ncbi:MAG: low molecular weight protein-tyrosine-phosphatase [Bacteroidaceae bacterium]|jgi:protein-tyrosine phosphatase
MGQEYKILFICLGNICRSPAAEEIMRHFIQKAGREKEISVASAGLIAYHQGELPDARMRSHAARRGYQLTHRSRPIRTEDFYDFDLIIGMDDSNIARLHQQAPSPEEEKKIRRMTDYLVRLTADHVPDPYYGGASGFENVLNILEDACQGLLETIETENDNKQ